MKIYFSVDMEGVACVTHGDHVKLEGQEYEAARKWMTAEVNAATDAAYEMGAKEIVIADSHGHMRNILPDELHKDVLLVRGYPRQLSMMEGLDESFDAAFFIGYHSMAGNPKGILAHTYSGQTVYSVKLNGILVGEAGFNAAIAGYYKVPVVFACGDDTLADEISSLMPWTRSVITKWAISPTASKSLTPKAAQEKIRSGVIQALSELTDMKLLVFETPIRLEMSFMKAASADLASDIPGVKRIDGRTVTCEDSDILNLYKIWRLMVNIGSMR